MLKLLWDKYMYSKIKSNRMVIHSKKLINGIENKILKNRFILIDNGQIISVTDNSPIKGEPIQYIEIPENKQSPEISV